MKTLKGFRVRTTKICLENEGIGEGGGGGRESHKNLLWGDHLSEGTLKGGIGYFSLCLARRAPRLPGHFFIWFGFLCAQVSLANCETMES